MRGKEDYIEKTRSYYDSSDADLFYRRAWGEEHIHLGIFQDYGEPMQKACLRTVRTMAALAGSVSSNTRILDIGSGYGGTARYLASRYGCRVDTLNLSEVQNRRSGDLNRQRGLDGRISIFHGSFEDMPFDDESVDICWSIDAMLHSADRARVVQEAARVLRPGGELIFTDPMRTESCPPQVLDPILERIHLSDMGSVSFYRKAASVSGLEFLGFTDLSQHLVNTYSRVLDYTVENRESLTRDISPEFVSHMESGLRNWVEGGKNGHLVWGIMHFRKN